MSRGQYPPVISDRKAASTLDVENVENTYYKANHQQSNKLLVLESENYSIIAVLFSRRSFSDNYFEG